MFLKNTLLCSLIITLIALMLMYWLNMSLKIILACSLIITLVTRIHYTFMYSLRKLPQLVKFFSNFGHSVNISQGYLNMLLKTTLCCSLIVSLLSSLIIPKLKHWNNDHFAFHNVLSSDVPSHFVMSDVRVTTKLKIKLHLESDND